MKPARTKRCRVCKERFEPFSSLAVTCSPACALAYVREQAHRRVKAETRRRKAALKTLAAWAKETQAVFNAYIRERDRGLPCISCGRYHQGQMHAGHYRSVGACPELRFEPLNVHAQCAPCNTHKSGNAIEYRAGLVRRIGAEKVEWLEGPHEPKKYTIDDLKALKARYRALTKQLRAKAGGG